MRAERLGSYSIVATFPGMPSLSRLKSMMRYMVLLPPAVLTAVRRPLLLRPPLWGLGRVSDFSGLEAVISSYVEPVRNLWLGVIGLYRLTAMVTRLLPRLRSADQD